MSPKAWFKLSGLILVLLLLGSYAGAAASGSSVSSVTMFRQQSSDYLGQTPPGSTPEIFAPDIVSVEGRYEYGLAVSPDGDEIFFTAEEPGPGLMVTRRIDDEWTEPEAAHLREGDSWEFEAFYTVDGQTLYFASIENQASKIWYAEKGPEGWGEAQYLDSPVNDTEAFWATFTSEGTMYYTDIDQRKIYRAAQVDGAYPEVEDAGLPGGSHPSVSPDESFLVFNSRGLGGSGDSDLFVSFRQDDGTWTQPQNLGEEINTKYAETCASLSPDGLYIFFSRYDEPSKKSNIYWVDSEVIEDLRPPNNS